MNGVSKTTKNDIKNHSGGALGMLLGTLSAPLFGDLLPEKDLYRSRHGITRAGHGNKQQIKKSSNSSTSFNKY